MGNMCSDTETDIDKLFNKIDELKIDADKGNAESEYQIGRYYCDGLSYNNYDDDVIIVKRDKTKGMEYLNRAASKGLEKAKEDLNNIIKWDKEAEDRNKRASERNKYRNQISSRVNGK